MSGAWFELLRPILALLFSGCAVKLMDDALDADYDICRGERTLAARLGRAAFPYGLVCLLVAVQFDLSAATSVFLGSYAVGMLSTWREKLPTRVPGFVEMLFCMLLSWALVGWQLALWGLLMMAVIDWIDDLVDLSADKTSGARNIAQRFGVIETLLLVLAALCGAVLLDARMTIFTFIVVAIVSLIGEATTSHLWRDRAQDWRDD